MDGHVLIVKEAITLCGGKISGNAHKVIIKDIEYPSISKAAELLSVNRSTVDRWINNPNKPDCFKVLENRKGLSDPS